MLEQIEQMNNILIEKDMYQKERELKSESTIQQQTKLIDFLQSKVNTILINIFMNNKTCLIV